MNFFMKTKNKPKVKPIVKIGYNGEFYIPIEVPRRIPFRSFYYNLYELQQDFPPAIYRLKIDYSPIFAETPVIEINPF